MEMHINITMRIKQTANQNSTTHLLEWPEPTTLKALNAVVDVGNQELSFIAVGNAKYCRYLGR